MIEATSNLIPVFFLCGYD